MRSLLLLLPLLLCTPTAAQAERLTVLELFTSQGCSSCPPADALLTELSRTNPEVLPLALHVTYWDRLGWKDPYSLPVATQRQREAGARMNLSTIYTPQVVVNGRREAIGSDRAAVLQAIAAARQDEAVPLDIRSDPAGLRVHAGPGAGAGTLMLVGFDGTHATTVRSGENGGRTLTNSNVVRSFVPIATWTGAALDTLVAKPLGERAAVILQAADGRIIGAAAVP